MKQRGIFSPADILLPREHFEAWSVIACDQFTSNPDYWEEVRRTAGVHPSTLHLIYPEVYLGMGNADEVTASINRTMLEYAERGVLEEYRDALIYVERVQRDGKVRQGLIGAVDLEEYDYNEGSTSRIRATQRPVSVIYAEYSKDNSSKAFANFSFSSYFSSCFLHFCRQSETL